MKKYKISLLLVMLVSVICFATVPVSAASTLSKLTTKKQLFAVPEGGWSSIRVNVKYYEIYTVSGTKNNFSSRKKSVVYKRAAVTYANTTKVTGNLPFTLSCSGGVPASSAGSVSMALKTK